jgi:signal transduction histidine kinase
MRRLYFRIYLAVLGSLLVFALLAGLAVVVLRSFDEDDRESFVAMGAQVAERLLRAERGREAVQNELAFWHQLTGFSLVLLSPQGDVIAEAGPFPPEAGRELRRRLSAGRPWQGGRRFSMLRLGDGRHLAAYRPRGGPHWVRHLRWLAALLGIALAVAIVAYPLVRHLTRRLERLQEGVQAFGAGDLSARVAISGRDEIAQLAQTFNASAERIERLMNAHKTLLANASHELRSPLSRLRMAVESVEARQGALPAGEEIRRNIAELDALVEEILLASRLQAGAVSDLKRERVDLLGLIAEECAPFGADLLPEPGAPPLVSADPRLLRRLIRNLLENAARHGGKEPASVSLRLTGGEAQIWVCDRGPGVPEDEREKIFQPFYRLRTQPESAGGAGLGLALVRQIAERHGGGVECLPREGGGACFRVTLPLAAPGG